MRCRACNVNLSDKEANRKYASWREIKDPEERYVSLCDGCLRDTDIEVLDNPILDDQSFEEDEYVVIEEPDQ